MEEEQPLKKMSNSNKKPQTSCKIVEIDDLGEDVLLNILGRLPAISFAAAAFVSRSWNSLCNRILSVPKLSSAVSFNPSLEDAVHEVVVKVFSEPIRPHFALASIGPSFSLPVALHLINKKLGSRVPVIVNVSKGVIGRDVRTEQFVEVQWEVTEEDDPVSTEENSNRGIVLTVGFLPGLKAYLVPLLEPQCVLVDQFVMDIKEVSSAVSGFESPAGIIMFTDQRTDIKPVLQTFEHAFSGDTFVVGDGGSDFLYRSVGGNGITVLPDSICGAVALVFARDRNKPLGIGETRFHVMLSTGLSPVGHKYKAASVKCTKSTTWLTASRDTVIEHLDGEDMLEDIYDELGERIQYPVFYIGVTKRRKCSVGKEKGRRLLFHEFHDVHGGNEEYLFVESTGIKTGDPFRFYISDSKAALSSCNEVCDKLGQLKLDGDKRKVFGGIIFSCCGRGDFFFGQPGIDSSPFLKNFPGITFGGSYCAGEIGRATLSLYDQGNEEHASVRCGKHVYSAVYLVMSYSPPGVELEF